MKYEGQIGVVDAIRLPAEHDYDMEAFEYWCLEVDFHDFLSGKDATLIIPQANEEEVVANPLDWIVKDEEGVFRVYTNREFVATFQEAAEQ